MRLWINSAYRLTRPHFVAAVRFVKFRVTETSTPHSNSLPIGRENKMFFIIRSIMRPWNRRTRNKRVRLRLSPCLGLLTAQTTQRSLRNGHFTPVKIRYTRAVQGNKMPFSLAFTCNPGQVLHYREINQSKYLILHSLNKKYCKQM